MVSKSLLEKLLFLFIYISTVFLHSSIILADGTEKGIQRASGNSRDSYTTAKGDLYAVIIGISDYKHPKIPKLKVSAKDAKDLARFLKGQTDLYNKVHVAILTNKNATKAEVEKHLYYELRRAGKDDTVIVFFSGHGSDDPVNPGEFFFLTYDADPKYLVATAVNMNRQWFVNKLDSKRILLIADACHAGGFSNSSTKGIASSAAERLMKKFAESEGNVFIMSSRSDELSRENTALGNSIFTYNLIEGLKGFADHDANGIVTLKELYDYTYSKTKEDSKGFQSPQMTGSVTGIFPISICVKNIRSSELTGIRPNNEEKRETKTLIIETLKKEALNGNHKAQFELGLKYEYGLGVPLDTKIAMEWYNRASKGGNRDAKIKLAALNPSAIPFRPPNPDKLLKYIKEGDLNSAKELLKKQGVDPEIADEDGSTALMWACANGNLEMVGLLLEYGADPAAKDNKYQATPLMYGAKSGSMEIVKLLLSKGADPNDVDIEGNTALMWAISENKANCTEALLEAGADPNLKNKWSSSPILEASKTGCLSTVDILLDKNARVDQSDSEGRTPLYFACKGSECRVTELLLKRGADPNKVTYEGWTPLAVAADIGDVKLVKLLLSNGAKDKDKMAQKIASARKNRKILFMLNNYRK